MIFSIIILLIVLGITYMHFLQGAFTSAISMACALAATFVAFGYYENVVNMMNQGGFSDYAAGMSLIVLFAISYLALRIGADAIVPGNIGLQLYVEKVGSVVFGFVAALLAGGTFAVGIQMMPMGPAIAGYSSYPLQDRDVVVPAALVGRQRGADTFVTDEVVPDNFDTPGAGLLLPADTLVLSLVKLTSDGSFSGSQSFATVHSDLPAEAFSGRVGGEHSGKHVILNTVKQQNATLEGMYTLAKPPTALDTEVVDLRPSRTSVTYKPDPNEVFVVLRVMFTAAIADKDSYVRLTPAAARLVIGDHVYRPVGSMEGPLLGLNRVDDVLPVPVAAGTHGIDLVYALPKSVAEKLEKKAGEDAVRFLEVKMFGRIDLTDKTSSLYPGPSKEIKVMRKSTSPLGKEMKPVAKPA